MPKRWVIRVIRVIKVIRVIRVKANAEKATIRAFPTSAILSVVSARDTPGAGVPSSMCTHPVLMALIFASRL
jgi:hypothetical protein